MERVWPEDLRSKGLTLSLQGPMSQHPSSLRVNYTSLVPSCSSTTPLRYLGFEATAPSGPALCYLLSICRSLLPFDPGL